MALTGQMSCLE